MSLTVQGAANVVVDLLGFVPRNCQFFTRKVRLMSTKKTAPDTIVLIHGFWVTPRSWEDWKARYESRGYRVLTPRIPDSRSRSRR